MTEQHIDVSDLDPPEPLERILDSLADLPSGQWLRVTHRRDPLPLYRMLKDMGYRWHTERISPQHFEIRIWPLGMDIPSDLKGKAHT
jgi:uncharacterized protein (DUF2249 family)